MSVTNQAKLCVELMYRIAERADARVALAVKKSTENAVWQAGHPNSDKWCPTDVRTLACYPSVIGVPRLHGMGDCELKDQIKALRKELKALEREIDAGEW